MKEKPFILLRYDYNNAIIPPEKRQVQLSS